MAGEGNVDGIGTGPAHDADLHHVSYHAVTRYVQRILGVEVTLDPTRTPPGSKWESVRTAIAHCEAAGTNLNAVRRQILTPAVLTAIAFKARSFSVGCITVQMANGVIVTISPRSRRSTLGMKIMTRKEERRENARIHRRMVRGFKE
ncbi:hypothetical protein [Mesorhizobium huakuii]|uniref:Uncharacterized protein n=1 Tax=Mesorhizobium huakuii TaxID=28104 RepID=A0A7G6T0T1_9HYPH|nr:hypothetical protein [Mesorhizobium huakuii]QND60363.1 hypothetical protein HB778_30315 [Mesorhizobium huakuii]